MAEEATIASQLAEAEAVKNYLLCHQIEQAVEEIEQRIPLVRQEDNISFTLPIATSTIPQSTTFGIPKYPPKVNQSHVKLTLEEVEDFEERMIDVDKNTSSYNYKYLNG